MSEKKQMLEKRRAIKRKKPDFIRSDANKKKRLGTKWRKPKGIDSKIRLHMRGFRKSVTKGYKSPASVKGLSRNGLVQVIAYNKRDLGSIRIGIDGVIIGKTVGKKNRLDMVKVCIEKNITILNVKDPKKYVEDAEKALMEKRESKKKHDKEKEDKKKEKEKAAEKMQDKKDDDKTLDAIAEGDSKKEEEKKEKDKLLTKKTS